MKFNSLAMFVTAVALLAAPAIHAAEFDLPARPILQASAEGISQDPAPALQVSAEISSTLTDEPLVAGGLLSSRQNDLWERIRIGFAMQELNSPLVQDHENWYVNRPEYLRRMVDRSQRYLFHIVEEVEKRGMPTEIALLPMIESAFNPKAYSRSHASGIWQFMPATGKHFGLQQNWWYDGRRDITAATSAALDYLQKLYDMFGSWELALAAYNWGEGNVARAISRNEAKGLPTDYLSLKLPPETRNYVPKLLAIKHIVTAPDVFGVELASVPNQAYFTRITTTRQIDLNLAARLAEIPAEEFVSLNPGHNRPVINGKGGSSLLLPVDKADIFAANLESYAKPLVSWQPYTLARGDQLDKVARKFSISVAQLKEVNNIYGRRKLGRGATLLVPLRPGASPSPEPIATAMPETGDDAGATSSARRYAVRKGDTLFSIARRHGVSPAQIKSLNHLKSNQLALGQKLLLQTEVSRKKADRVAAAASAKPAAHSYTVRRGDTLGSIAKRFKVATNDIQRWNNNLNGKRPLAPGAKVTLFLPTKG